MTKRWTRCAIHEGGAGHEYSDFCADQQNCRSNHIYQAWQGKRLTVLTCAEQLVEIREVTRRVAVALRIKPAEAGRMVNSLHDLALMQNDLPVVQRSPDPKDDFILALVQAGGARYIVTGDKSGLLALGKHAGAEILSASSFVTRFLS